MHRFNRSKNFFFACLCSFTKLHWNQRMAKVKNLTSIVSSAVSIAPSQWYLQWIKKRKNFSKKTSLSVTSCANIKILLWQRFEIAQEDYLSMTTDWLVCLHWNCRRNDIDACYKASFKQMLRYLLGLLGVFGGDEHQFDACRRHEYSTSLGNLQGEIWVWM